MGSSLWNPSWLSTDPASVQQGTGQGWQGREAAGAGGGGREGPMGVERGARWEAGREGGVSWRWTVCRRRDHLIDPLRALWTSPDTTDKTVFIMASESRSF